MILTANGLVYKQHNNNNNNNTTTNQSNIPLFNVKVKSRQRSRPQLKMAKLGVPWDFKGIPFEDFQQYIGVLDVDGNSWSERFPRLLCQTSVVLKVEPEFVDFLMPTVQPWVHYIPVKGDSSDLWNVSQWVVDPINAHTVQSIIRNANDWCIRTMTYQYSMESFLTSLEYYVEQLEAHDPYWHQRWATALQTTIPPSHHDWVLV